MPEPARGASLSKTFRDIQHSVQYMGYSQKHGLYPLLFLVHYTRTEFVLVDTPIGMLYRSILLFALLSKILYSFCSFMPCFDWFLCFGDCLAFARNIEAVLVRYAVGVWVDCQDGSYVFCDPLLVIR